MIAPVAIPEHEPPSDADAETRIDSRPSTSTVADAPPALVELERGELIAARYVVDALLGRGGFGEVYRVHDLRRSRAPVALKLHRLRASRELPTVSLAGEFALLASLVHPHLAKVYDFGHVGDDAAFFTQSIVKGVPIDRSGLRLEGEQSLALIAQLCRALDYLHARGILHRDIKPSNVLVDVAGGRLTLLDFGVARAFGPVREQVLVGTFAYLAPEAITGSAVDARVDLYALGVMLYKLLAGYVPFRGTPTDVLAGHLQQPAPPLPEGAASPALSDVVMRLLQKEPGDRPASALEALELIARAAGVTMELQTSESLAGFVLSPRLVGRANERARLVGHVGAAAPGARPLVVVGEAGTGKSRLLREAQHETQLRGGSWLAIDTPQEDRAQGLLREIADAVISADVLARLDDDDRIELSRALPRLRRRRERIGISLDPDRAREIRIAALARAIELRFAKRPGVLVVEDLHRASRDVAGQLALLARHVRERDAQVAVVVSTRPGAAADVFSADASAESLTISTLDTSATRRLVESMFGDATMLDDTELGRDLAAKPHSALWVQESLRLAIETGAIVRRAGRWEVLGRLRAAPLQEVLALRVGRLSQTARSLGLALAVIGRAATVTELALTAGRSPRRIGDALREVMRAGIVEDRRDASGRPLYGMHDRFVDTLREGAAPSEWRAMHRRTAAWLAKERRADYRRLGQVSEHLVLAGDLADAAVAAERAAGEADRIGRPDLAITFQARAIELRAGEDDTSPASMLLRLHDLAVRAGAADVANVALSELRRSFRGATARDRAETACRIARDDLARGDAGLSRKRCALALVRARACGFRDVEHRLLLLRGDLESHFGAIERAVEAFGEAARSAAELGDRAGESRALLGATFAELRVGRALEAQRFADRAARAALETGDPELASEAFRQLGNLAREQREAGRARVYYARAVRAARESGNLDLEAKALNNLGAVAQWLGLVPEGIEALSRSIALKERAGAQASALTGYTNLGGLLAAVGRLDEALTLLDRVLTAAGDDNPIVAAVARSNAADVCAQSGDLDRAIAHYRAGRDLASSRTAAQHVSNLLMGLARTCLMRRGPGDLDEARGSSGQLASFARDFMDEGDSLRHWLTTDAMLADASGDSRRMLELATRAVRLDERWAKFSDLFGTRLETEWIYALALARAGRDRQATRALATARRTLARLTRMVGDDDARARFETALPLHRAILAGDLTPPLGSAFRWQRIPPMGDSDR